MVFRFLFNENKTTEQVINIQQDDKPKNYIPLVYEQQQQRRQNQPAVKAEYKMIPAMTDDRPSLEENLNTKEEEEHINIR